jgi:teichuronic acid biosynthesis glycosyltransferase TuaG
LKTYAFIEGQTCSLEEKNMSKVVPTVSVILPVFNVAEYIRETLNSVIAQTYHNFEIIIIDDCSSDNTRSIVREIREGDARLNLICLEKNMGAPAGPRNIGVAKAKGKWIAFLDADDTWHPRKLEEQLKLLVSSGNRFCSTASIHVKHGSEIVFPSFGDTRSIRVTYFQQQLKFRTPTSSVIADADLIKKYPFNESPEFKAREDLDCWLHCHEEIGHSVKIVQPMMGYRIISDQISANKWTMLTRHIYVLRMYKKMDGSGLGLAAYAFTLSHFLISMYTRFFKKGL